MMEILLSILIPTVTNRQKQLIKLLELIDEQQFTRKSSCYDIGNVLVFRYYDLLCEIEIKTFSDDKTLTIGQKRELMYKEAKGKFSWMIDDDDSIADNAIELILQAIKSNPEIPCITFREKCIINGEHKSSNHSIKYDKWQDNFDDYDYTRTPFYKDVIRTDIAQSVPFPHIRYNEDEQWAAAIKTLLTEEIHIDEELYHYIYEPKDTHEERYGLNRD